MGDAENSIKVDNSESKWKSPGVRQLFASVTSLLPLISIGCTIGYPAILLPQLSEPGSFVEINPSMSSWIASIAMLPLTVLSILSGYSMEKVGRKKTHYIMCILLTLGWLIIGISNNLPTLFTGRFITGLGMGLQGPLTSVYIAETTSPKTRHVYLSCIGTLLAVGILFSHAMGSILHWKTVSLMCTTFSLLSTFMALFIPDTPTWYKNRGKLEKSSNAFRWFRGTTENANKELEKMIERDNIQTIAAANDKILNAPMLDKKYSGIRRLMKKRFYKPLIIMILFFIQVQISGNSAVCSYSVTIIDDIMGVAVNPNIAMVSLDTIRLLSSIFASGVVLKYCGRRTVTIASGLLTSLSLLGLALFVYLQKNSYISKNFYWVSLVFLSSYVIALSIGVVPLPWSLSGELFPADLRGVGSSISTCFTTIMIFVVTKTAPIMFEEWGSPITFAIYGSSVLILTVIILILLPETKGKTLQEIEESFER